MCGCFLLGEFEFDVLVDNLEAVFARAAIIVQASAARRSARRVGEARPVEVVDRLVREVVELRAGGAASHPRRR
jgi:hypothetical protein